MEKMDKVQFNIVIGEVLSYCQSIEYDVTWILALLTFGDPEENFKKVENLTLGQLVSEIESYDKYNPTPRFTYSDYQILREITNERNYICHQIFVDFIYVKNCYNSLEYQRACDRLSKFYSKLKILGENIQRVRYNLVMEYKNRRRRLYD